MKPTKNPIITRNFDVSTSHITAQDNVLLKKSVEDPESPLVIYEYKEGYFIYVPTDNNEFDETEGSCIQEHGFSEALVNLLRESARLGCKYLQLDCDAVEYENFPTFEW